MSGVSALVGEVSGWCPLVSGQRGVVSPLVKLVSAGAPALQHLAEGGVVDPVEFDPVGGGLAGLA